LHVALKHSKTKSVAHEKGDIKELEIEARQKRES
jgi:hypothetical protein